MVKKMILKKIWSGAGFYDWLYYAYQNFKLFDSIIKKKKSNHIIENQKKSEHKLLLIAAWDEQGILTINQCVNELVQKSKYQIDMLNVKETFPILKNKIDGYDGIIIHNTVAHASFHYFLLNQRLPKKFTGIKVLVKQDEHYMTDKLLEFVWKQKIDLVLTIWEENIAYSVYSENGKRSVEVMQYLTGYVPESYRNLKMPERRSIDVGYRGSVPPLLYGKVCYEKATIGEKFKKHTQKYELVTDISVRKEDVIPGNAWIDFLLNCKAVLAVESGSNIVDIDGNVRKEYYRFLKRNKYATERQILDFLAPFEEGLHYTAISPRHLEAAACKTLQIMYEGDFQGIFKPWIHYVPLKRDFSNIDEVINALRNEEQRKKITDAAYDEIIMNEKYSFDYFVKKFDERLDYIFLKRGI